MAAVQEPATSQVNGAPSTGPLNEKSSVPSTVKNIVVLGASYAGLPVTHYILRHVISALPNKASYHVTLVDPSSEWFVRVGAPRGIVSESLLPLKKFFLPTADGFKEYAKETFTFLQGKAASLDYNARNVTIQKADGTSQVVNYYALIIATGAASPSPLLGVQGNHATSVQAIEAFRKKLPSAKSIVIGGGGPAGVESAGEIGQFLNGTAGFFSSRPSNPKAKITLISADSKLLPVLRPALAKKAEQLLQRVGVDVIYNTKVQSTVPESAGRLDSQGGLSTLLEPTKITLSNGETIEADLFIPAWGLSPNTSWLPKELLNERGKVVTNKKTLRVEKAGPRVYALGEAADYGKGGVFEMMNATPVININIKRDLLHDARNGANGTAPPAGTATSTGKDKEFEDKTGESQLVPVGRTKGVGAVFNWKLPGLMVYLIKGRDYMSSMYPDTLSGKAYKKDIKWAHM